MSTISSRLRNAAAFAAFGVLLIVAGCETAPGPQERGEYTTRESGIQRADRLVEEARTQASPRRDRLLLEAADIYVTAGRPREAGFALDRIDREALEADDKTLFLLVSGELAMERRDPTAAQRFIEASDNASGITARSRDFRLRWHRTRGEAFALLGKPARSVFELSRASALIAAEAGERQDLHDQIWQQLGEMPADELNRGAAESTDSQVAGWYQLAAIYRKGRTDITGLIRNVRRWQRDNPQHPAARVPPENLRQLGELNVISPAKITVLLPMSGSLEPAAETLTDGIIAGYYDALGSGSEVPELQFVDSDGDITAIYRQAVAGGAELVIGPLQRDQLAALAREPALPVPVLGFNYLDNDTGASPDLYQFGLSIRDEARQIAEQGWQRGHRRTLVIVPDNGMGENAGQAFAGQWLAQGGDIVSTNRYSDSTRDYTELLKPALLIDQSTARATRLKRLLGKNIDASPRRRGDVDMITLVAYPEQGRQIKPALDFLYAGDLPVFATSHIYTGYANPELDQDLNGIAFTAMPWTIQPAAGKGVEPGSDLPLAYRNLFAMGVDAFRLHQWLEVLKTLPDNEIRGQTGKLSLADGNRVRRQLPWARFEDGLPVPEISAAGGTGR